MQGDLLNGKEKDIIQQDWRFLAISSDHSECLPDGDILTIEGIKDISNIQVGEKVFDSTGTWNEVENIFKRNYEGDIISIKPVGFTKYVSFTPNHTILILDKNMNKIWKNAKDITKQDKLTVPIPKHQQISLDLFDYLREPLMFGNRVYERNTNPLFKNKKIKAPNAIPLSRDMTDRNFLILCGLYISEGNISNYNAKSKRSIFIAGNTRELAKKSAENLGLNPSITSRREGSFSCVIHSSLLATLFCNWFGHTSKTKILPNWVFALSSIQLEILIDAMWKGDGGIYHHKPSRLNRVPVKYYKTTSPTLAYQLQLLLLKLGIHSCLHKGKYKGTIKGYKTSGIIYNVRYAVNPSQHFNKMRKNFLAVTIRDIKHGKHKGNVYDLEVKNTHTYTVNNLAVRACLGQNGRLGYRANNRNISLSEVA